MNNISSECNAFLEPNAAQESSGLLTTYEPYESASITGVKTLNSSYENTFTILPSTTIFDEETLERVLNKMAVKLPTDITLKDKEFLVVSVEVGNIPPEERYALLQRVKDGFNEQGLTRVIINPVRFGIGELTYTMLDVEDKFIE